jgi:amino acid transporter
MVAAMCEEVQNPEREVPKAMVLSVAAAAITGQSPAIIHARLPHIFLYQGIIYLIPILFVLPDIPTLLSVASGQPMPLLYMIVTGSPGGGFGLLFLIIGIGFFAGIGALTAACKSDPELS